MKLTKCVNGHFYDEEKFESCPHCAGGSKLNVNAIFGGTPSAPKPAMSKIERDDDMTVPLEWTPAAEPEVPVKAETPAVEPAVSEEEAPVVELVSPKEESPAAEPETPVEAEAPVAEPLPTTIATSAEPPIDIPEEKAEEVPSGAGAVEADFDIQSQPSFDTPIDFDGGFTGESEKREEEAAAEPAEEFELLSKFDGDQTSGVELEGNMETEPEPFAAPEPSAEPEPFAAPEPSAEPEPFVAPEPSTEPEPFVAPEPSTEPEPFVVPEPSAEPEPFVAPEPSAEPEPFVAPEPSAESDPFVMPEPGAEPEPFAASEPVAEPEATSFEPAGLTWEMPEPSVEEIPTGEPVSTVVDPELEEKPTEIVNETDLGPFVIPESAAASVPESVEMPSSSVPSPAAAMFGASVDDDDDEHTVAFYDEIFVSKAPAAPVVPEPVEPAPVAPSSDVSSGSEEPVNVPEGSESASEPEIFTAPPLQPAQALPTPCVGWLIALNGVHIGQDFHLRVGKNYIGRDVGMDIALTGDKSVSRNKHAIVIYEPKHHKYFIQPGESNELVYVNDEVVLLPMPLKPYDVIVIGDIELWFMPLCDEQHNWSEVIRRLQEQM